MLARAKATITLYSLSKHETVTLPIGYISEGTYIQVIGKRALGFGRYTRVKIGKMYFAVADCYLEYPKESFSPHIHNNISFGEDKSKLVRELDRVGTVVIFNRGIGYTMGLTKVGRFRLGGRRAEKIMEVYHE